MNTVLKTKENFIDLLGDYPKEWTLTKNKYSFLKKSNGKNDNEDTQVLSLTINGIKIKSDLSFGKTSESYIGHQLVNIGDIVFTPRDFDQTPILADVSNFDGCISNLYIVDKPNSEFIPEFVVYFWYGLKYSYDYFKNFSHGIRFSFNRQQFDEIPLLKPTLDEQKLICNYLDKKTSQIDKLIENITNKITLLDQEIEICINEFVTKGTDTSVKMKDSGIQWIGRIPEHWSTKKLKYISNVSFSSVDRHIYDNEKQVNICHYTDVYRNEYVNEKTKLPQGTCSEIEYQKFSLKDGDIIITKDSESPDDIGIPTYVVGKLKNTVCGYHLALLRMKTKEYNSEYFYRFIESKRSKDYLYIESKGVTRFGLGKQSIENLIVPIPPVNEQILIASKIASITSNNNEIKSKLEKKLTLLVEYRKSLISSVVKGKLRISADMI